MDPTRENELLMTRRQLFGRATLGVGTAALASLLKGEGFQAQIKKPKTHQGIQGLPHFAPKAKRVIYLTMNGGPSQHDLWDYKPKMQEDFNVELPDYEIQGVTDFRTLAERIQSRL